jgi:hypothetical protein
MGGVYNTINAHLYHYAGNNPVKYTDPDGKALNLVTQAFVGALGGAAVELTIQAAGNITQGKGALDEIDWSDVAVSAGIGAVAAVTGTGITKQFKNAIEAGKKLSVASETLKAGKAAVATGKVRNAEKLTRNANIVIDAKKTLIKSTATAATVTAGKALLKEGVNLIQESISQSDQSNSQVQNNNSTYKSNIQKENN